MCQQLSNKCKLLLLWSRLKNITYQMIWCKSPFFFKCCLYFSVVQCLDFLSSGMFFSLAAVSTKVPRSFPHLVPLMPGWCCEGYCAVRLECRVKGKQGGQETSWGHSGADSPPLLTSSYLTVSRKALCCGDSYFWLVKAQGPTLQKSKVVGL